MSAREGQPVERKSTGGEVGASEGATRRAHAARVAQKRGNRLIEILGKYGLLAGLAGIILVFSLLRPDTFPTVSNLRTTLILAAPLMCVACGLTVVLVMQDFDLSIGGMIGLSGAVAVVSMSEAGLAWPLALVLALLVAVLVGVVNGSLIAYLGASSFIITLAMGTILLGTEFALTGQTSIFEGVPAGFTQIATAEIFGFNLMIWIAAVLALVIYALLHQTELGRYMHAIGGNPEAARLSGVPVARLRVIGFVIVAVGAAVTGLLISSQAAASTPNSGASFLLPAFAAVFLGTAVFKLGEFNVPGTVVGVLFLSVIQVGLTQVDLSTSYINIIQGVILVAAVLSSRIDVLRS